MKAKLLVSIILPTFNRRKSLQRSIEHVRKQTYKNWELIIVDDHSIDGTKEYLQELPKIDRRIKVFPLKHIGYPQTRIYGIKKANGEIVTFLDDDDYYKASHLKKIVALFNKDSKLVLLHGTPKILGTKMVANIHPPHNLIPAKRCVISGTMFMKRAVLNKIKNFPKRAYGDDYSIHNKILDLGYRCHKINMPTYIYDRRGKKSITKDTAALIKNKKRVPS